MVFGALIGVAACENKLGKRRAILILFRVTDLHKISNFFWCMELGASCQKWAPVQGTYYPLLVQNYLRPANDSAPLIG